MSGLEVDFENNIMMSSESSRMGHWNEFSDYGSGDTSDSSTMSWGGPDQWHITRPDLSDVMRHQQKQRASSLVDLVMSGRTINDVMAEFKMNGFDSPYNPDEDPRADGLSGLGPAGVLLRQKSWPEPERTPVHKLPTRWTTTPEMVPSMEMNRNVPQQMYSEVITEEQRRVLLSLPPAVVQALLRHFDQESDAKKGKIRKQDPWCRFCRNNGERESYYRSHCLKDAGGRVRCPVLRAFVCPRCGARGDTAHTIKYCPLSTAEERVKSTAMMRSVRLASGRRRSLAAGPDYVLAAGPEYVLAAGPEYVLAAGPEYVPAPPPPAAGPHALHPLWAALEQKLML